MVGAPNPMIGKTQGYTFRCKLCNNFSKTNAALKSHLTKKKTDGGCKQKPIDRSGTLAVKRLRRQERQKDFDRVKIGDHVLENVLSFTYLGSNFEADGNSTQDVKTRIAVAKKQFGSFMHTWLSNKIPLKQKLRLYKAGVLSVLTFGHTNWILNA